MFDKHVGEMEEDLIDARTIFSDVSEVNVFSFVI